MVHAIGYGNKNSFSGLKPLQIERKDPADNEVQIEIMFCGVCHSDIHQARNEWKNTIYPCVPGHEIVGKITKMGEKATKYKIGDLVGVGCMVDSCQHCDACNAGLENYCEEGFLATYNGNARHPAKENLTFGGYSNIIVVRENFVLKIPENMDPAAAAPILCAGVTTYSPLRHWKVGHGTKVGVVGLGGLGHLAVQIAVAMKAEVTVITTSPHKAEAARALGAKDVIDSGNKELMKAREASLDFILTTIPESHDINPYITLLKRDGVITVVGCLAPTSKPIDLSKMIMDRKSIGTSVIGGIGETQEVLDFCSQHNIAAKIEIIPIQSINDAFDKIAKSEIHHRYVIDMKSLEGVTEDDGLLEKIGIKQ